VLPSIELTREIAVPVARGCDVGEAERAIEALGKGDVLVLAEWDRATRSMLDGIRIIERVAARGATFKPLDRQWLDLTTPLGRGILAFLSALAEDERSRILAREWGASCRQETRCEIRA
jgi:DNA invertase Pin-like site-specific DNA recombinase